jgi:hypothetical protein
MISWFNMKQTSTTLSTAEAEYIATCSARSKAMCLQKLLIGLFDLELEATCVWCHNQSCVELIENLVFSKHIEIRNHYIRDIVQKGAVKLQYVAIDEQIARSVPHTVRSVVFSK